MGMDDAHDLQIQCCKASQNQFMVAARSTTMACRVIGSPIIVQLHCNGPTGKVSRISVGFAACMEGLRRLMDQSGLKTTDRMPQLLSDFAPFSSQFVLPVTPLVCTLTCRVLKPGVSSNCSSDLLSAVATGYVIDPSSCHASRREKSPFVSSALKNVERTIGLSFRCVRTLKSRVSPTGFVGELVRNML